MRHRKTSLLAVLALVGTLLHAPAAQADPFTGISSLWSLLAPRAKVVSEQTDVYRKRPLQPRPLQPRIDSGTRVASGAPAAGPVSPAPPTVRQ